MNILIVPLIILIQGLYDFIGWKVILGDEDSGRFSEKVFRVVKFILDFPVTIYLTLFVFDLGTMAIVWFYILKWFHSCDRIYNWLDKIFYKSEAAYWGYWRWWTFPLGIIRTNWFNLIHLQKGYTYKDFMDGTGKFSGLIGSSFFLSGNTWDNNRGMVNINEVNKWNNFAYIWFMFYCILKVLSNLNLITI